MTTAVKSIPFIDLAAQRRRLGDRIDRAVMEAVDAGQWIMGPQVAAFERRLADYGQAKLALSCANGTDALALPLMAWGLGPGDAVFCPSFTFTATAESIAWTGASPVFVDVLPDTYNISPEALEAAIEATLQGGALTPRAIVAVDLFGQPAVLLVKMEIFDDDLVRRNAAADRYAEGLADMAGTPTVIEGGVSTWAQYTIEVEDRDALARELKALGVPTAVYYPVPLHQQVAYRHFPTGPGGLPVTEAKARRVISLPISADLTSLDQDHVIESVRRIVRGAIATI